MNYMRNSSIKNKVGLLIFSFVWLISSLLFSLFNQVFYRSDLLLFLLCIETLLAFFLLSYLLYRRSKTFFKIVTLFVMMYFLYLEGQVLLNCFGLTTNGLLSNKFDTNQIVTGILQVHIYMAFFLIGSCCAWKWTQGDSNELVCKDMYDMNALVVGYVILLCSLPFEVYVILKKIGYSLSFGYASLYQDMVLNSIPSGAKILSYFFVPACLYLLFASRRKSFSEILGLILILIHAAAELIIGYRASSIIPIIMVLYCFFVKAQNSGSIEIQKKTKSMILKTGVALLILAILVFPVVRASRNSGGLLSASSSIGETFSVDSYKELFSTVNDMGKSLQTVVYTAELVPDDYPYRYGYTYLVNLTEVIPNLFWERHPAEVYGSLGKWLTKIVDPNFYKYGGTLGYSCVAEAYINFGYIGLVFIPFLFGYILQKVENRVDALKSPVSYAAFATVALYLMSYPRGESAELVRGIFWYMLMPYAFYSLTVNVKEKRRQNHDIGCSPNQKSGG